MGAQNAATDPEPRAGVESATTVHIGDSAGTDSDERHDVALDRADRCLHGAKNNRIDAHR
jgi:hypothetical protein